MKPAPFEYAAPRSLQEALDLLAENGSEAKVLAGGQSLLPLLHRRRLRPRLLVDLNRIAALDYLRDERDAVALGALCRQRAAERSELLRAKAPLLSEVLPGMGDAGIRNRGTVVGNLVYADWGAQPCAVAVALGAVLRAAGPRGERELEAARFFRGVREVELEPDELALEVRIPAPPPRTGQAWAQVADRHGDLPIVGAAAVVTLAPDGLLAAARLALCGVAAVPVDAGRAAGLLAGERPSPSLFETAGAAAAEDAAAVSDGRASAAYRRRLVRVLGARALALAAGRAA